MRPAQLHSLQRAVDLAFTHQPGPSLYSGPCMSSHPDSNPRPGASSTHHASITPPCKRANHRTRQRRRDAAAAMNGDSYMRRATSGSERAVTHSSRGHNAQGAGQPPHRHEHTSRTHASHRTSSPPSRPRPDMADRRRHRSREEEEEDDNDDQDRAARRARTERSTSTSPAVSAAPLTRSPLALPSSSSSLAHVQALLPSASVATCILPLDAKLIEVLYALSPTSADREGKLRVIEEVRNTLQKAGLDIQIYGSLCTGVVIPASDVDCVMMRSSDERIASSITAGLSSALLNLSAASTGSLSPRIVRAALSTGIRTAAERMRRHPHFASVTCIAHAKVPIVKCRHRQENVKVDLSFEKDGCVSSNYLCELFCEPGNELARPLIVLVKALVNHCGLDDPSIGGLGSFPISLLVLWYLKQCVPVRFVPELRHSVAVLLVGFLKYYGSEFDYLRQGIDYVQHKTFDKAPANELFIVNPLRPGTNCARAATLFASRVVPQFQKAANALSPLLDMNASGAAIEQRLLQFYAKALPDLRDWREVSRAAARGSHLPQNMWDQATNLYMGGVL